MSPRNDFIARCVGAFVAALVFGPIVASFTPGEQVHRVLTRTFQAALVILLLARLIVRRLEELLRLDEDLLDKRLADARLRELRDSRVKILRSKLIDLRRAAEAVLETAGVG